MRYRREILAGVEGYAPGEQPQRPEIIKLNTNENPYPPSPRVIEVLRTLSPEACRKYPDPLSVRLREACARRYGYPGADWVIATNGMDELLAMTVRTFVDPGDIILTTYPTYTLYETLALLHGAETQMVDLDEDFELPDEFFAAKARLVFLPRPNAPTGAAYPLDQVERLCHDSERLVFIDEAYVDFADSNCMDFPKRFENVVIGRTFSKSFSLAGLRVGIGVAHPDIIQEFIKTKDSYNVNAVSQAAAIAAIEDYAHMESNAAKIRATRARLSKALATMGFRVPPSQSNFVLAIWDGRPTARQIFEVLRDRGIFVRYFDARRLAGALRISIGTDEQTDTLLNHLREILR